jgi:hypothetical protein
MPTQAFQILWIAPEHDGIGNGFDAIDFVFIDHTGMGHA